MPRPKHQFPTLPRDLAPADVKLTLANFRNDLTASLQTDPPSLSKGKYKPYENKSDEHSGRRALPKPSQGCEYREIQVGQAHTGDTQPRGSRRLVVEINQKSFQVKNYYFTGDHYKEFHRLVPAPKV